MKKLLDKILSHPQIKNNPPVLVDIGASGKIHSKWNMLAEYSICIAFDADERDFKFVEGEKDSYKKLFIYNKVATNQIVDQVDFYLTKSPYCSGHLKPDNEKLNDYLFSYLFSVVDKVKLNAVHLQEALNNLNIHYVDWFKSDSQGTDLRLFQCLSEDIKNKILIAEFEPGFIDAYEGEDKLFSVLNYFNSKDFWLSDIGIKGTPRIPYEIFNKQFKGNMFKKLLKESIKQAPGWGEMTFINSFKNNNLSLREYLLGWLFTVIEKHYAFSYVIAESGFNKFSDDLFKEMKYYSRKKMKQEVYKLKFIPSVYKFIKNKF